MLWQNPQVALVSPAYPLAGLMPLALAMKVNVVIHYVVGFVGMHLLLTEGVGLSSLPLVVCLSSVFVLSGALALHVAAGHSVFLPAFYLPLLLLFLLHSLRSGSLRDAVAGAGVFAWIVYAGGLHVVPLVIVSTSVFAASAGLLWRDWRPVVVAAVVLGVGAACAGPRLVPTSLFVTSDRFVDARSRSADRISAQIAWHTYFDADHADDPPFPGQHYGWQEYGNYVGWPGGLAIAFGLVWTLIRPGRREPWIGRAISITALALLVVSFGNFSRVAPAALLSRLPFFSSFRIPSRFSIAFALFGVVAAGWAARGLDPLLAGRTAGVTAAVLAAAIVGQLALANRWRFENLFRFDPAPAGFHLLARPGPPTYDLERNPTGAGSKMFRSLMSGQAFYNCYEPLEVRRVANPRQPIVVANGDARIFRTRFSPNRVEFAVTVGDAPAAIMLNENDVEGWSSTAGPVVRDRSGRPSVVLLPGAAGTFAFSFFPPGLGGGALLLVSGLAAAAWLWRRRSLY